MKSAIGDLYYTLLLITTIIGIVRYKGMDKAMRSVVIVLIITSVAEALSFIAVELEAYSARYTIYHIYNVIQAVLLTRFFIYAIRPRHAAKLMTVAGIAWLVIGILNVCFLQPLNKLNTNILLLESFSITSASLYYVYWLIRKDTHKNIFRYPHFQLSVICLVSWSGTFFFWAFIGILYNDRWPYVNVVMYGHALLNILSYSGIAAVCCFTRKRTQSMQTTEIAIIFIIGSLTLMVFALFIVLILVEYRKKQVRYVTEKLELEHRYRNEVLQTQIEVQEQSFKYMSEEIHDNIAQMLSLVKIKLYKISGKITDEKVLEGLNTSTELLSKTMDDLRMLSHTLNGQLISRISLTESLEKALRYIHDEDMHATLKITGEAYEIDAGKKLLSFRIVQEAINNAIRHGKAQNINISLTYGKEMLTIIIKDDGDGFDTQLMKSSQGLGLQSMQLRAQLLGAMEIASEKGSGTTITLNIYTNGR